MADPQAMQNAMEMMRSNPQLAQMMGGMPGGVGPGGMQLPDPAQLQQVAQMMQANPELRQRVEAKICVEINHCMARARCRGSSTVPATTGLRFQHRRRCGSSRPTPLWLSR